MERNTDGDVGEGEERVKRDVSMCKYSSMRQK